MTRCPRCQRRVPPRSGCKVHGRSSVQDDIADPAPPAVVCPHGWSVSRLVATGGSAFVYEVKAGSGAPAILKWGRWRDDDIHARFGREVELLRTLGPPATPAYIAHGTHDGWPYVLMEAIPGETLAAWMARSGEQGAIGEIVTLLLRVASALRPVHAAGFVHRDLKPENIVIGSDTRILDFGIAVHEREEITQAGTVAGTVHYLAPEQIKTGSAIDRRVDIYSFGVIAFEMLAGQPPFTGERRAIEYQHQVSRPPPLRDLRPDVPAELEQVVSVCLAKQPDARPQTIDAVIEMFSSVASYIHTLKGVGTAPKKAIGARDQVVLAWIEGGDPITVSRAINDAHGMIVRSRPNAILAAFAAMHHEAPLAIALATCRELVRERTRVVLHADGVLARRSAHGKPSFYGAAIEQVATWTPRVPFTGLVLTAAAAELAGMLVSATDDPPGFWREARRHRTSATEQDLPTPFVGRDRLVQDVAAVAGAGGMVIGISGATGAGKTRFTAALVDKLRAAKREVIAVRGRRHLFGDRAGDTHVLEALGDASDLTEALVDAGARRAIIVIDDAHLLSRAAIAQLVRDDLAVSRVLTSRASLFEVAPGTTRRLAIELPALDYSDAERLLRSLLQPARLIPDVLLQRLALRGVGNPGLLVALAREIRERGGVRRHAGSDEWYVAADEIDTLLAAPSSAWYATRVLDTMAFELVPVVRAAAALGPRFSADELANVAGTDAASRIEMLVRDAIFTRHRGSYEFTDASLQEAIYDHLLDERSLLHGRALRFWLANRMSDTVGWLARLAHHASGSGDLATAGTCYAALAREARLRGEAELAEALDARVLVCMTTSAPTAVADAVRALIGD